MSRLPDSIDGLEATQLLYGGEPEPDRAPVSPQDPPDERFDRYCQHLEVWRAKACALPDGDVEAAADAFRMEARRRRVRR